MGAQNVFGKKLDIIETLGACTCICTDKTGTLTQNLMSVANLWVVGTKLDQKAFTDAVTAGQLSTLQRALIDVATLNSRVALEMKEGQTELTPTGDATELGLYRFFSKCIPEVSSGQVIEDFRNSNPKVHEVPFNSANKWQMSIHRMKGADDDVLFLKGAPDVLLSKCNR